MDPYLVSVIALALALPLVWWLARRQSAPVRKDEPAERIDTLIAWPPETTRILRPQERLAFSTLKLALPGYMILAQVPVARFLSVPKRNSYAEWMRRVGSQCVDFVVCDVTSQVIAVVEIRPPAEQISDKLRSRLDRIGRVLKAASIPVHVWNEEKLPTIEAARERVLPRQPAVPDSLSRRPAPVTAMAGVGVGAGVAAGAGMALAGTAPADGAVLVESPINPFADTDRDWTTDAEVIEVREPNSQTWFDELESVSPELPPLEK